MKGYSNRLLRVDLTSEKISVEDIQPDYQRKYLGGLGYCTRMLYDEVPKGIDPLGPENKIIIAPGTLVATGLSTASKTALTYKSPLTGGFGRSIVGAHLGVALKKAGYDALIIEGKSEKPAWIFIEGDKVEIRDASHFWGRDIWEVNEEIQNEFGKQCRTGIIGVAGEKLSLIAGVDFEQRQAARAGVGAVWGSKKLKVLSVIGNRALEFYDADAVKKICAEWREVIKTHPATEADMGYGSGEFYDWMNRERGTFPTRNWQQGYFQKVYDNLKEGEKSHIDPYYWAPKYQVKYHPCPQCSKPCGRIVMVKEGKYAGSKVDGIEYECIYSLGGTLEIDDIEAVIKENEILDRGGMDAISAGVTLAWAMECYEKGILTKEDTDGLDLSFGNADAAIEAFKKMVNRDGKLGELLADGVKRAAEKVGKGSEHWAIHSKGLELPAYDVRGIKGMGLAMAVSVRGGCHLTGGVYGIELGGSWWKFENVDRLKGEWKGYEVATAENLMTLYDTLGICKFSRHIYYAEGLIDILKAVTGRDFLVQDLITIGESIYNISKAYNVREGFGRKDDHLPPRILKDPIPAGVSKGSYITEEEFNRMLDEYYMARGWNREGIPTKVKLFTLDLPDVAEEIGAGIND